MDFLYRTDLKYRRESHCCYAGRKFNRRYAYKHEEILSRCG